MKLELLQSCIEPSVIIRKEISHSNEYERLVEDANEKIKEHRNKQFKAIQQVKNYIHNYDNLPVVKDNN